MNDGRVDVPKSARLALRIDPDLKARVEALAAERGQTLTVFVERALEVALGAADGMKAPESVLPHGGQSSPAPPRASTQPMFNRVTTLKR